MSRTYRILLVAVVAVLAVGGYWKLLLSPKRAEATTLQTQVATEQAQLAQTQNLIATYSGAKDSYQADYATVLRLGKAVPTDDDTRSLVVQLDAAAKRTGVDFDAVNLTSGGSTSGSATGAPGSTSTGTTTPGAINAGAFAAMPFNFSFDGTFATLGNFFTRLESFVALDGDKIRVNGRLLRIETISLAPSDKGWPAMVATVGASSYILPQSSATTTAPSTSTPSTSTGAAATTAPSTASSNG